MKRIELGSDQIIQADSPTRLILLLDLIGKGCRPTPEEFGAGQRQVLYYKSAARAFGLLSAEGRLLTPARVLLTLQMNAQMARLAIAFEQSECARLWMSWYGVKRIFELTRESAEGFLSNCTTEISGETLGRRRDSLVAWLVHVCRHHPAIQKHPEIPAKRWTGALGHTAVFDSRESAEVVQELAARTTIVRVATAYLSVIGFNILSATLEQAVFQLLIGSEDAVQDVAEVLKRFELSISHGSPTASKRRAIQRFYRDCLSGIIRIREFVAGYRGRLHAKVYLFDDVAAYVTSSNLSRGGLRSNIECGYVVRDEEAVNYYLNRFDDHFQVAVDLVPPVLNIIEKSWAFQSVIAPYIVYLRTILELFPDPPDLHAQAKSRLSEYQQLMVAAILHVFRQRRRALLVAPTGTGKTHVGSYVGTVLLESREITRIIVLCPNESIGRSWKDTLEEYGRCPEVITHGIMQGKGASEEHRLERTRKRLGTVRSTDLLIVDECHAFRNPLAQGHDTLAGLVQRHEEEGPFLLLLTATPISKGLDDLNTLLRLLGDVALKLEADIATARSVVNVTLPFIYEHFGKDLGDGRGRGIMFPDGMRYFARVEVRTSRYDSAMGSVFEFIAGMRLVFRRSLDAAQRSLPGMDVTIADSVSTSVGELIRLQLMRRAESSPQALKSTIESLRGSDRDFVHVDPIAFGESLDELAHLIPRAHEDTKLKSVVALLRGRKGKALIFSMWTATVEYLAEHLRERLPNRRIESVTGKMSEAVRSDRIRRFAPNAQKSKLRGECIDILIATDAIAEGENLQDATTVINYDLPWTPLFLVQRIGRVDRATAERRRVRVWNCYPESEIFDRMVSLWQRLRGRADTHAALSQTHVFGEHDRDLAHASAGDPNIMKDFYDQPDYENLKRTFDERLPTSAWFVDRATANEQDIKDARSLPRGALAARMGGEPGTFVLLRDRLELRSVFAPAGGGPLQVAPDNVTHELVLQRIRAAPDEEGHVITDQMVDDVSNVVERWCHEHKLDAEEVEVICGEVQMRIDGEPG